LDCFVVNEPKISFKKKTSRMTAALDGPPPLGLLLRLPHDVLVDLFVRLELHALGRLAATCRLLQYGQSSPQTQTRLRTL
jgi:hypothetical protein